MSAELKRNRFNQMQNLKTSFSPRQDKRPKAHKIEAMYIASGIGEWYPCWYPIGLTLCYPKPRESNPAPGGPTT